MACEPTYWKNREILNDFNLRITAAIASNSGSEFDVEDCLMRLRRDKADVVRESFASAALAVLYANSTSTTTTTNIDDDEEEESITIQQSNKNNSNVILYNKYNAIVSSRQESFVESCIHPKSSSLKTPARESAKATTAASSAVMDSRAAVSRAVLCAAASMTLADLTCDFEGRPKLDALLVPQRANVNMGAVLLQAKTLGQRAIEMTHNAVRRSTLRLAFYYDKQISCPHENNDNHYFMNMENPFASKHDKHFDVPTPNTDVPYNPNPLADTTEWSLMSLPRLKSILNKGAGHAVYCDLQWNTRHGRIAHLFHTLAHEQDYFGPHLIITTKPNVVKFASEFYPLHHHRFSSRQYHHHHSDTAPRFLRVLHYTGTTEERSKLRRVHFASRQLGRRNSPFHVLVTSYQDFLADFADFCQLPFEIATADEGFSWLSAAQTDPNSQLGTLWEALFSRGDGHIGMASSCSLLGADWEFGQDMPLSRAKLACMGLTCRHRLLTAMSVHLSHKQRSLTLPGLYNCLLPHLMDVVREEWDRSRITHDGASMDHWKHLIARSVVVHARGDLYQLALDAMDGNLHYSEDEEDNQAMPPQLFSEDDFVADGKISQSRRQCLGHLGYWLCYELGMSDFGNIADMMKESTLHGHVCDEILPASATTASGASGAIVGTLAYRLGVRCGRSFGSEQGLRQHIAAMHAPPGTWLCRTCASDCGTSQARTHHERSCGVPQEEQTQHGPVSVVGKKAKGQKAPAQPQDKDSDGSFRIPGFRGVWVNPAGKHFVKIDNRRLKEKKKNSDAEEEEEVVLYFESPEEAAKKHDEAMKGRKGAQLNFNPDGTRVMYDDNAAASAAGRGLEMLGGGSSSVVPALSVINIKDLPKDVKPLLRDPRQTSRTGGNSKRHVYAYRGVCRQARKGHDRWQSQISFGGTNHYLGTFDSEWDAAAVYAWAHLILYGEDATKKAQREGEEAAAAYEREKAAIAAGQVPPTVKTEKKKKTPTKRKGKRDDDDHDDKKAKTGQRNKPGPKPAPRDTTGLGAVLSKAVQRAPVLGAKRAFEHISDEHLMKMAAERIVAARKLNHVVSDLPPDTEHHLKPNLVVDLDDKFTKPRGGAMLLGLDARLFGWIPDVFLSTVDFDDDDDDESSAAVLSSLVEEYGPSGHNKVFCSVLCGSICVIGRASSLTEGASKALSLGPVVLGGTAGDLDCNIGGTLNTCGESAVTIQHLRTSESDYQIIANNNEDIVTLNGKRITADMGPFPIGQDDICSVGARVFAFLLPRSS